MLFIAKYKNLRVSIRPTIKQLVHTGSGGQDVIVHRGVTVEFQNAVFDTKNWSQYRRPESPDHIDVIKTEEDLIRLLKANPNFGIDFFEREEKSISQRRKELESELAKLEAEESAQNPDDAPEVIQDDMPVVSPVRKSPPRKPTAKKPVRRSPAKTTKNTHSKLEL